MKWKKNLKAWKFGVKQEILPQVVEIVCPPPPTRIPTQWIYTWKSQTKHWDFHHTFPIHSHKPCSEIQFQA